MKIKIYDGTQPDSHLCKSCIASVVRTENSREVTICRELPMSHSLVRGRVTQCSSYQSISAAVAMRDYQANAWHLDKDEDGSLVWSTPADRDPFGNRRRVRVSRRRNLSKSLADPGPTVQ